MNKENNMLINRDNALSLWTKRYGKATRVKDFSGREMDKGSYDNRNSQYGWNLDHILPKSRGGKDTESNLICVHIKTNDEKADKFPVFTVNEKIFEIIKVENHYEIKEKASEDSDKDEDDSINFFDHSDALKFFKDNHETKFSLGTIYIELYDVKNNAIFHFIKEVFDGLEIDIQVKKTNSYYSTNKYKIFSIIENITPKEMTSNILDACVMINTYLKYYFKAHNFLGNYCILFKMFSYDYPMSLGNGDCENSNVNSSADKLIINDLVKTRTSANKKDLSNYKCNNDLWEYDYSYIKIKENLGKVEK